MAVSSIYTGLLVIVSYNWGYVYCYICKVYVRERRRNNFITVLIFGFWSSEIFIPARQPLHLELSMTETGLTVSGRLCQMRPVKAERGHPQEKQVEIRAIMAQQRQIYHGDNLIAWNTVFSGGCTKPEPEPCVFPTVFCGNITARAFNCLAFFCLRIDVAGKKIKRALGLITVQRLFLYTE